MGPIPQKAANTKKRIGLDLKGLRIRKRIRERAYYFRV